MAIFQAQKHLQVERKKSTFIVVIILVILHLVGLVGYNFTRFEHIFTTLTPYHLLLTGGLALFFQRVWSREFFKFLLITFLGTFLIELLGVKTGLLFGEYHYGNVLGPQIFGTPIMIGFLWTILVYGAGVLTHNKETNQYWLMAFSGAGILVLLDFFLEPFATEYGLWFWNTDLVPFKNYLAWFLISFIFLLYFHKADFSKTNPVAIALILIQMAFFILCYYF